MTLLPQIEGGYLVNQGMLLQVDDVDFDVVDIKGGRRPAKNKYNYSLFQPKVLPTLNKQQQKRKLRSQSHDNASTGSDEDSQREERSKKQKDVSRSKSLASSNRTTGDLTEESKSIFTKYAQVAKAQKRTGVDANQSSFKNHAKSKSPDSMTSQHVRFDDQTLESYPEVVITETKHPQKLKPLPGYLKPTQASGKRYKHETDNPLGKNRDSGDSTPESESGPQTSSPSRLKATQNSLSHRQRLLEERRRAQIWRETASDPGKTEKSIQNDQVIKGRTSQNNKRKHPTVNRNDERPRGAERGRRMQSLPSRKETHDAEERPVNSAPSKEQPKSEAPMPKVNSLVKKSPRDEKDSSQRTIQKETRPVPKVKEPDVEDSKKDKPKPVVNEPVISKKPPIQDERPKPAAVSSKKQDAGSSDGTPAPSEGKKPKVQLPPDDHGPIIDTKSSSQSSKTKDDNFKYYATDQVPQEEKVNSETLIKEKTNPLQLRLQSEKSMKTEKPPPRGHMSRDISPSKSQGRGRDITPSKSPRRDISPGKYIKRFEKAKTMTERTEPSEFSDTPRKKREVTIMDPKDVRKEIGVSGEEGFPTEYEMGYERRSKTFEQMTEEEKVTYFKHELKLRPEQIRELTFHPKTTRPKQIHRAYTGMDTGTWRQKSARMKSAGRSKTQSMIYRKVQTIPPSQRKSHMLSKLQGVVYRHINKVYGTSSKDTREKQFFEKLARVQLTEYQKRYEKLADNEQKQLEMKYKQREQLQHLRKKFEEDAWRRFMTQYVTSKVMESEYRDRSEYGLPNDLPKPHVTRNQRHIYTMTPKSRYRSNRKKYANLFNFNSGPELKSGGKPLKFEGFDAIYIDAEDENGSPTKKRQDVQALMEEAMDLLQAHDDDDDMDEPRGRGPLRKRSEPIPRRYDRPHRSVTRSKRNSEAHSVRTFPESRPFKPYTEGHSIRGSERARPKPKPRPKTIRELYGKRNPVSSNRYKASEFSAMKQNLLKDSERMKRKQNEKDKNSGKSDEAKSTSGQEKSAASRPNDRRPPPPNISPVKPPDALKKIESKSEQGPWRVENGNVHLEGPETQIEVDSERAKLVKDNTYNTTPVSDKGEHVTTTTTTTKIVTTTTTRKTSDSPDKKTGDSESVSESVSTRQDRRGSIISQRRGSVPSIQPGVIRAPLSRTPSMATIRETGNKTLQRTPSRASLLSTLQKPRPGITQTPRAPSRISVLGNDKRSASRASVLGDDKNNISANGNGIGGRLSRANSTAQSKSKPASGDGVNTNGTAEAVINVTDAKTKQDEPTVNGHAVRNGSAGSPVTVTLGANDGRVSPIVSMSSNTNDVERKSISRRPSIRSNQLNIEKTSRQKSPSPSVRSRIVNGHSPMRKVNNDSRSKIEGESDSNKQKTTVSPSVEVQRSEHISEVVTDIVQDRKNNRSPVKSESKEQSPKSSEDRDGSTQGKPVHDRSSRANNKDGRQSSVISQGKDQNHVNGHGDTKMKRDEYEKKGQGRNKSKTPTRSRSRNRKDGKRSASRSRERKRSTSKDKKRGKGKSTRFPDIDNRPNSIAKTSPVSDNTKTNVSRNVKTDETVNERELSPKQGTEQWRDLVSKYMRQPSPKISKTADRALLDASFDTDDDDDDIFARAQRRYALSISDAESDA